MTSGRMTTAMMRRFLKVVLPAAGVLAISGEAQAQEVQVTGPLAGAPAVRNLRLHRKQRFEIAPTLSFTLLDEYQRHILIGARLNYNITDWLAIGVWGAFGPVRQTTGLSDKIQSTNDQRYSSSNPTFNTAVGSTDRRLVAVNVGKEFKQQLGRINWLVSPQITATPFRGKLAIFQKIFVDTDAYFFAGPAFVNLTEREDCGAGTTVNCSERENAALGDKSVAKTKGTASRLAIAPTFGLGLTFYTGKWTSFGMEWRGLPFSWNTGGFDVKGGGENGRFPDNKVDSSDRQFHFNQMLTLSFGMYLPTEMKSSELSGQVGFETRVSKRRPRNAGLRNDKGRFPPGKRPFRFRARCGRALSHRRRRFPCRRCRSRRRRSARRASGGARRGPPICGRRIPRRPCFVCAPTPRRGLARRAAR